MKSLKRHGRNLPSLERVGRNFASCVLGVLLASCQGVTFEGARPLPGNGPNGSVLRSSSEVAVGLSPAPATPLVYPITARVNVTDKYHGVVVEDPYRWLEDLDSDATRHWVEAENNVSKPRLEALPHREWVKQRLTALWSYERFGIPVKEGGRYFFLRNDGKQNQSVLFVSDSVELPGKVLFDPNAVREDATISLADFTPSRKGDVVAYALSDGGTDWQTWKFRRVSDGKDLTDTLRYTKFWGVSWALDGSGVYYSRYPSLPDGRGDDAGRPAIYFHRMGQPQEQDKLIYAVSDHPTRVPTGRVTEDGRYLIVTLFDGYERNGVSILDLTDSSAKVKPLFYAWDALYSYVGSHNDLLFFNTTKDAPNRRVIAVDAKQPTVAWTTIVPEQDYALEEAEYVGGRIIAKYVRDAHSLVRVYEMGGRSAGEIALPGLGQVAGFTGEGKDNETFFSYTDYLTPTKVFRYEVSSNTTSVWRAPSIPASTDAYMTEQVFYKSKDGTRIPMFITHRRDMARDGNQPLLLYGYGGFDVSVTPTFRPSVLAWLEMGGVYAEANLRGGGEYGEAWHRAGTLTNKQNVFDDFISAAEYLISERYTRTGRLGIQGRSNGGLLVGAALTQRPDLFAVALPTVGVLDMLRYHTASANARQWSSDYGLSEDAQQFQALYAYSPYHNVKKLVCYPPTLITTADHDDRVAPWHSFKFAAALQAAQVCSNPILIRIETRAGHGAGKPVWMQIEDVADQWAFAAKALGMAIPGGS
jgi:prolyl oligopeptidase